MIISTTEALEELCKKLSASPYVTVDTEFLRESTFWPILCLIQIADKNGAYVIDPLSENINLSAFYDLMKNSNIVKVFHACRQDVEIFWHEAKVIPQPLFDSQVAAMVLGLGDQVSYETLVQKICKVQIDKSQRFTDWSVRPLSERQITYALADVTHLRRIYEKLSADLEAKERTTWVAEEMALLADPSTYESPPETAYERIKGGRPRNRRELALLQAVAAWREREAQAKNQPRRRIFKDEVLQEVVRAASSNGALQSLRGLPQGFFNSDMGRRLLVAVQGAQQLGDDALPALPDLKVLPHGAHATLDLMKVLLRQVADDRGVAPKIVATVEELEDIILSDDANVPALNGWRRELFGEQALALKHGKIALIVQKNRIKTLDVS